MPATRSGSLCFKNIALLLVFSLSIFARPASAQFDFDLGGGGFGQSSEKAEYIEASAVIVPATDEQPALLVVTADILAAHSIYSITQGPGGPIPTKILVDESPDFRVGKFVSLDEPKRGKEKFAKEIDTEKHVGTVSWYAPIVIQGDKAIDSVDVKGKVRAQVCNADNCFPPKNYNFVAKVGEAPVSLAGIKLPMELPSDDPPENLTSSEDASSGSTDIATSGSDAPPVPPGMGSKDGDGERPNIAVAAELGYDLNQLKPQVQSTAPNSMLYMMGAAMLAGFILNFMPCVLPVIGLKVLSFLEQGGSNPRRVLALNLWYSLGIISVFWILAGISIGLQSGIGQAFGFQEQTFGWGQQFRYDAFNITLVSIVFVMALSFLGVWEIPIPGFAGSKNAQGLTQKEGAVGAYSKGVITTVLATPCSGPFLGTAVGFALQSTPIVTFFIFTLMGIGMAAPYILVGFKPSLMRFLPKPGAWMDTFKQVMGFVLIGTVLWLLRPISPSLLMPTLIFLAALSAACWWIGRTPVYANLGEKLKAWIYGSAFAGLVGWWFFAAPQMSDPLPWKNFTMAEFVQDLNDDRTVLVEFTADWCATCKALKLANLDRTKTKEAVERHNVVTYEVDIDHLTDEEMEFFTKLQPSQGVPLVAVFGKDHRYSPICFGDGYTQSQILNAIGIAAPSR